MAILTLSFLSAKYVKKDTTETEMHNVVANQRNMGGQNDYYAAQNTFFLNRDEYDIFYHDNRYT